ncbi:hypothetical protein ACQ4PT_059224 [Festuca glaucescens]
MVKKHIEAVLAADLHNDDKNSYGKLELKPEFGVNCTLFGGAIGFSKWMDTCSDLTCPIEQKAQVANLMGSFASGMVGLMGSLVQGWTAMHGDAGDLVAKTFGNVAHGFLSELSASSAPAERVKRGGTSGTKGRYPSRSDAANTRNVLPEDNTFLGDDTDTYSSFDGESSSDDDVGKYVVAPRKDKQVKFASSVGGDDAVLSHTAAEVTATLRSVPASQSVASPRKGDKMVPLSAYEAVVMKATSVPDSSTPADSPPAANVSDVFVDILPGQDIPQVDDTTRQAEPLDFGGHGLDQLHLAQCPVVDANKNGKGKRRLQPLRVKDKEIRLIVANELGITTEMVQVSLPTSTKEVHDAKKATPKRKQILKRNLPATRSSPCLAKHRVSVDSSKLGAPPPVIDVDPVSPETSAARVEVLHPNDAVMVDVNEGAANDAPGLDVDKGAAANPSLGPADLRPPSPPRSESSGTDDVLAGKSIVLPVSIKVAPPAVSSEPSIIDKEDQAGSRLHDVGVKGGVPNVARTYRRMKTRSTDDVITTTERVVTNVEPRRRFDSQGNEFVSASTLFAPIPEPAIINVTKHAKPSKKADNLLPVQAVTNVPFQGFPDGLVAGKTPLTDVENPMWNFTSQSHVCSEGPSVDNESVPVGPSVPVTSTTSSMGRPPYATVGAYDGTDHIPEGIPIEVPVGAIPVTTSHPPGDLFADFEGHEPLPLSWAIPSPPGEPKLHSKDQSGVISLDDLLLEKGEFQGVQSNKESKSCCNTSTVAVHDMCDLSTPAVAAHVIQLSFPVLQNIGTDKDPFGHWFVLSLNFEAKRFEILDSLRGEDDEEMVNYANRLVDAIKIMYKVNYSESRKQIDEYELILNCGIFMLKFLELWNGIIVPAITADQIDAIRKVLTVSWLEHPDNKLINWRILLDNNMF